MVGDVLSGETAQRQQDQQQPAETPRPLAPGLLPGQLQRLVAQLVETLDRRLVRFAGAAQGRDGLFLGAFLVVFIQGAQAVAALAEAGLVVIVVIEAEAKFRRILGAAQRHEGYPLFRQRFAEARFLARIAARRLGRFGIGDQRLGPAFVMWIAFVVAARQQAFRRSRGLLDAGEFLVQLEFVELGQFLVEVEAVQVEVVMDPQGFVARARCRGAAEVAAATLGAGGGAAAGFASAAEGAFARGAPPTWCCRALKTFRQVPQRTAPLAAPSCASLTRKLVLQWGHWVMTLSLMRRSVGKIRRLVYPKLLARRQWGGISGGWQRAINRRGGGR